MFNEAANFDVTTCRVGLAWNHVENDIFMSIGLRPILSSTVPCQEKLDCKYHEKGNWILPRHFSLLLTKTNHKQEDMTVFIVLMEHTQRRKKGGKLSVQPTWRMILKLLGLDCEIFWKFRCFPRIWNLEFHLMSEVYWMFSPFLYRPEK